MRHSDHTCTDVPAVEDWCQQRIAEAVTEATKPMACGHPANCEGVIASGKLCFWCNDIEIARAEEREACAKIAIDFEYDLERNISRQLACREIAAAIRARGEKP